MGAQGAQEEWDKVTIVEMMEAWWAGLSEERRRALAEDMAKSIKQANEKPLDWEAIGFKRKQEGSEVS